MHLRGGTNIVLQYMFEAEPLCAENIGLKDIGNCSTILVPPLVIFPISGNNTFETSDFADLRFSF